MSTVQDERSSTIKNLLLLRRRSIDKIKCSAYPILGSIFEKKSSLIHAFDNVLMNLSSRTKKSQMAVIFIPALQFFCLTMTSTLHFIRTHVGGVSLEYLEKVIYEFNQRKLHCKRLSSDEEKKEEMHNDDSKVEEIMEEKEEKFYDCLTAPAVVNEADVKSGRLLKFSYGLCLVAVYAQLAMLLYMLGFCAFRLGFLFLLACVAAIAYIVLKISFEPTSDQRHGRKKQRHSRVPSAHQIGKVITFCRPIALVLPQISCNISEKSSSICSEGKQKIL